MIGRKGVWGCIGIGAALLWPSLSAASPTSIERGRRIAEATCASCHAVGREPASAEPLAPPFRALRQTYPSKTLEQIVATGLLQSHAAMPEFGADQDDMDDLLDYIRSVQAPAAAARPAKP